jgi:tetratricopeptide (TPR) repeat protein
VPLRHSLSWYFLIFCLILSVSALQHSAHAEVWDQPSFTSSAESLRQAAASVRPKKDASVTILLNEERISFDAEGKAVETYHGIYRIENENGVKGWAEISSQWEPWHQAKPEMRARVVTPDGVEHLLDLKTLTDVPVHENSSDTYSDQRAYGGPLPAIAIGSIVEEEITSHDTAPFFSAGIVQRFHFSKSVPVNRTHIVLSHPLSLPFRYVLNQMPGATLKKSTENGIETIDIENGPMDAHPRVNYAPFDVATGAQVEYSTGTSWREVAAAYARMSNQEMRLADVQSLLAKLNVPAATTTPPRNQVITRLLTALHRNVRYTGVEFGEASLIPQPPSETLKRKYGDCKDKAALLATMLRASGIPASLALLDTGPGQDINTELPGMGMFDHAIVYVPANGSHPELWIDATSQYSRLGDLPYMDYGRWALIVDEKTTALKKIPELNSAANLHRETRQFTLAEFGNADIVEKNEEIGPGESDIRDTYSGENKELHNNVEKYVKRAYLADKLISLKHGDIQDLEKQFWTAFTTSGKRGTTDYENATMAIRLEDLFDGFPNYFTTPPNEKPEPDQPEDDDDEAPGDDSKPRLVDWQIRPFTNEWDYKITAPAGYKLRALPPSKEEKLASATFAQKYTSNADGTVVEAVLRFDSGKARLTVDEAKALRDAVLKAQKYDPVFVVFDQVAQSLIAKGNIREGLASYQQLIQLHPKEALHRIQLARALLSVGLGEKARVVAREATTMDPNSARAFSTLAWVLEHDLIGRLRKKGFDYDGAVAAYRKAKQLDPKDKDLRLSLAILLEYDAAGQRYTAGAHLKEAVAEFAELKKMDEEYVSRYEDNVLYDLWYAHDVQGLKVAVAKLPATDTRRAFVLAAAAEEEGAAAALRKSLELTTEESSRSKTLAAAGSLLVQVHNYGVAADVFAVAGNGRSNEAQSITYANMLRKAIPRSQFKIDDSTHESVIQRLFYLMFARDASYEQTMQLMSKNANRSLNIGKDKKEYERQMSQLRLQVEKYGIPVDVLADITIPNMRFSSEGSDSVGYNVTVISVGAEPQHAFVVREDGGYKVLDLIQSSQGVPHNIGWQALQELNNNNLAPARQWLDWARDLVHLSETDDPLAGEVFPHFWTKGGQGDAAQIRRAALSLIAGKELRTEDFAALKTLRDSASSPEDKARVDLLLARGYAEQELWSDLVPVAQRLLAAYPESLRAYEFVATAYASTKRLDEWQKLLAVRMAKHPDELAYTRSATQLARYRGDYTTSRKLLKALIDNGKASGSDLNSYAWDELFLGPEVSKDSIEAAERGTQLSKNSGFGVMHTLACLYARAGKPTQARDILLKAMDAASMEVPDSSVWLAYGMIAESVGEPDAARQMLARVEKMTTEVPSSNFELAQQSLASLNKTGTSASAVSAR